MQQKPFAKAAFFRIWCDNPGIFQTKFAGFSIIRDFPDRGVPTYILPPAFCLSGLDMHRPKKWASETEGRNLGPTKNAEGSMLGMKMMKALLGWLTYFWDCNLQCCFFGILEPENCKMRTPRSISRKSPFWGSMLVCWGVYWMYPDENYSKCL